MAVQEIPKRGKGSMTDQEYEKELAELLAYVKAHNLKVLEGEEHV